MYFQDFNGLDLLRAHASMTAGLPIPNGLDTGGNPLGLPLSLRDPTNNNNNTNNGNNNSNNGASSMLRSPPLSHTSPNGALNNNNNNNNHNTSNSSNNLLDQNTSPNHHSHNQSRTAHSPRPGSANRAPLPPNAHPGLTLSSLNALNLIQTPKPGLKPPTYSSPPPIPCNPEHNICKLIEYRGAKVAAFMVDSRELICLPQAFELFLKHLVGGLHTVYTKLKRLEITPIVCNVEQVRILRGLGAIQPGVNRCKLISCAEFDTLYEDCTNSNARPGRPPKRVHSSAVDADVLDKLKRRKLEMSGEYPYDNRFYDRKLMNGFPHMGYPSMPQFPNLFNMHHLMQPVSMAMASHIGLRSDGAAVPKLDRTTSDSGIVSPRARDDRLGLLGMYGPHTGMDPRLAPRPLDIDAANKPLNLQVNGHLKDKDSEGSRTEDEGDGEDDKMSEDDRHDDDDCYDSDEYNSMEGRDKPPHAGSVMSRALHSPVVEGGDMGLQDPEPPVFADFDGFADKLNALVQALVDQAKSVERRIGDEKNRVSMELVKEKERRLDLEKEVEEERKRREFFQRRVRRLKNALKLLPEETQQLNSQSLKSDHTHSESSPEPVVRNTQESGSIDSESDKVLNTSAVSIDADRKTDPSIPDRQSHRRESFEPYTPGRRSPGSPSPVKFQYHPIVAGSDV